MQPEDVAALSRDPELSLRHWRHRVPSQWFDFFWVTGLAEYVSTWSHDCTFWPGSQAVHFFDTANPCVSHAKLC
jgi:hypothetical protein